MLLNCIHDQVVTTVVARVVARVVVGVGQVVV